MHDNIPSVLLGTSVPSVSTLIVSSELLNEHNRNKNITHTHKYCTIIGVLLLKHQLLTHCKVYSIMSQVLTLQSTEETEAKISSLAQFSWCNMSGSCSCLAC